MAIEHTGECLCGAVHVRVKASKSEVGACHCGMCRRWGGGPLMCVDTDGGAAFEGGDAVGVFSSSDWAERGFCKTCGTHLYYHLKGTEQYWVPVGLLGGDAWQFTGQVFIDEKPAYYDFANETKNLTGAEIFAMFAPTK